MNWCIPATILVALCLAVVWQTDDSDASTQAGPRCAIKNFTPMVEKRRGNITYITGDFHNRCLDPVGMMGSYACLVEREVDSKYVRLIECQANEDWLPTTMRAPHSTNVFMKAVCDYTTIPRFYYMTGYGWAISLPTDGSKKYMSKTQKGVPQEFTSRYSNTGDSPPIKLYCHITKKSTFWRNTSYGD